MEMCLYVYFYSYLTQTLHRLINNKKKNVVNRFYPDRMRELIDATVNVLQGLKF